MLRYCHINYGPIPSYSAYLSHHSLVSLLPGVSADFSRILKNFKNLRVPNFFLNSNCQMHQ